VIALETPLSTSVTGAAIKGLRTVRDVLVSFPQPRRKAVAMGLMWMAKLGLIDWLA
jgi:hypothetical protein